MLLMSKQMFLNLFNVYLDKQVALLNTCPVSFLLVGSLCLPLSQQQLQLSVFQPAGKQS